MSEFLAPQTAVPHLVGKGGRTIRTVEDWLGVIIRIIYGNTNQKAEVTLVGSRYRLELA